MSSFDSCSWSWIYKTVARLLQYYYYYALVGERDSMESFVFMEIQNNRDSASTAITKFD